MEGVLNIASWLVDKAGWLTSVPRDSLADGDSSSIGLLKLSLALWETSSVALECCLDSSEPVFCKGFTKLSFVLGGFEDLTVSNNWLRSSVGSSCSDCLERSGKFQFCLICWLKSMSLSASRLSSSRPFTWTFSWGLRGIFSQMITSSSCFSLVEAISSLKISWTSAEDLTLLSKITSVFLDITWFATSPSFISNNTTSISSFSILNRLSSNM